MIQRVLLLVIFCGLLQLSHSQIQRFNLPSVCPQTQNKVLLDINVLGMYMESAFWINCPKLRLYRAVMAASASLHKAADELKLSGGSFIDGCDNSILGNNLVVIGSGDRVVGINSWIFASNYSTKAHTIDEGVIIIRNYKIQVNKAELIKIDPTLAISVVNPYDMNSIQQLQNNQKGLVFRINQSCGQ